MSRPHRLSCAAVAGIFFGLLFAGCVGRTAAPATDTPPPGAIVLSPQDYEYVYVTGSNLPVLRPRHSSVQPISQIGSPVTTMTPEQFRDLVRRGQTGGR